MPDPQPTAATDLSAMSEEDLARRVQSGCGASFEELVRRMQPRLIHLLRRRTGSAADAEDIAQEAFFRAYQRIDRYQPRWRFSTWLFTIALRLATDHYRAGRSREAHHRARPSPGHGESPLQTLLTEDLRDNLWATAQRVLDERQHLAMWLRYGEDQDVKEIAQVMGMTRVHVRVLLHRARQRLAPHVQPFAEDRADRPPQRSQQTNPRSVHRWTDRQLKENR